MGKMVDFFERASHEVSYQTNHYIYRTVIDGEKVKLYRTTAYILSKNPNISDIQNYPQLWDYCYERPVEYGDSKLMLGLKFFNSYNS